MSSLKVLLASVGVVTAHMGITLNGEFPREKTKVFDNYRSPDLTATCHGTTPNNPSMTPLALKVGDTAVGKMTYGAAHGGGHCTWMVAEKGQQVWYKINDDVDCTMDGEHNVKIPAGVPVSCATEGCVLGWFWTPRLSGGCEIYMNCFDATIEGATGPVANAVSYEPRKNGGEPSCTRVGNDGRTPIYGTWMGSDGAATGVTNPPTSSVGGSIPPTPATVTSPGSLTGGCATHKVKDGEFLCAIAELYDFDCNNYALLQTVNQGKYPSLVNNPQDIEIGWELQIPQTENSVKWMACNDTSNNVDTSSAVSQSSVTHANVLGAALLLTVWSL